MAAFLEFVHHYSIIGRYVTTLLARLKGSLPASEPAISGQTASDPYRTVVDSLR